MPAQAGIHLQLRFKFKKSLDSAFAGMAKKSQSTSSRRGRSASAHNRRSFSLLQKLVQPIDGIFICRHHIICQFFEVLTAGRVDLEVFLFRFGQ